MLKILLEKLKSAIKKNDFSENIGLIIMKINRLIKCRHKRLNKPN